MSIRPDLSFKGQTAIITGAGHGLGRTYALELARRGANVIVNDLPAREGEQQAQAELVVEEIRAAGGSALASLHSVADPAGVAAIVQEAEEAFGRVDVLINNAGIVRNASVEDFALKDLEALFAVHVIGAVLLSQHVYRIMCKQHYGRIVTTTSHAGIFGRPGGIGYSTAKAALLGLANVLALEGARYGILSNAVLPVASTGISDTSVTGPEAERLMAKLRPISQRMDPSFVTPLVVFLASKACTTTRRLYSAVAGRYSEVFTAVTPGWSAAMSTPPTAEAIAENLSAIRDQTGYVVPDSLLSEIIRVAEAEAK